MDDKKYQLIHSAKEIDEILSVVLPFVELETVADTSEAYVTCTERDSSILDELADKKMPIAIRAKAKSGSSVTEFAGVFICTGYMFQLAFGAMTLLYYKSNQSWLVSANTGA